LFELIDVDQSNEIDGFEWEDALEHQFIYSHAFAHIGSPICRHHIRDISKEMEKILATKENPDLGEEKNQDNTMRTIS
jgi:hypothetical protein